MNNFKQTANFIWDIANLLRGDYKQSDYGKIILPFTVLRRLDSVLAPTKEKVLSKLPKVKGTNVQNIDPILNKVAGHNFHNRSKYDFDKLVADPNNVATNLRNYINGFSENAREIIEYFDFDKQIDRLEKSNLLYLIIKRFQEIDLHPSKVSNLQAGYMFEELIRKFAELSNETAGEHFTPREVIRLMVNILFIADKDILTKSGIVKTLYDPAGGTGGMLSVSDEYVRELNKDARLELFGQEINPESYAIFKADMLIKGQNASNVKFGNSFTEDGLEGQKFDYMLSNPPFGVSWKKVQKDIKKEHEALGMSGRFGAGLPRVSDGSLLFLQHMMAKIKAKGQGTRLAIVFNGSPLFTGGAGSGESEIRRWVIENDYLETIISLPDQLFYNTGISTYIWVVDNKKRPERKGKVQLINAVSMYEKMSKSLGNKRNEISSTQIEDITKIYGDNMDGQYCKIFDNEDFGYRRITVERPLKDEDGNVVKDKKGSLKPDSKLRDYENIPLKEDIEEYFKREVLPHVPDAWIDHSKTKVGYEVNFTRYFYEFTPLRSTIDIRADILKLKDEMTGLTLKAIN
ncbi:MAG: class I SAM-dependent DNA methyltransferase [Saprospiraceae bacterium]|nr:class I SAM-dependent DNA methyltransferase [Saprospiraceae bacterium]